MNEILLANERTLEEHVDRILKTKEMVQLSVFEMAEAITDAVTQFDGDKSYGSNFTEILADRIGMSVPTLYKWTAIGSNQLLIDFKTKMPVSFSTLYQLTVLDNQYQSHYGEDDGRQKFLNIIENEITPDIDRKFVNEIIKEHRKYTKISKSLDTQKKIENALGKSEELEGNIHTLEKLLNTNQYFSTFVIVPTKQQLSRWRELELDDYIYDEFPLAELRKTSHKDTLKIIFKITMRDIETAIKCLYGFGFVYRDTLIPENKQEGFNKLDLPVFVIGERGNSKSDDITLKSASLDDVLIYGETTGSSPYLLVGSTSSNKKWSCILE
tara:strand:+ start:3552 stop:4529 length:978 start_codon:yes stop_codon:yes gene_type:complete